MSDSPSIALHLEQLPRTIALVRAGEGADVSLGPAARDAVSACCRAGALPDGAPVLVLLDQRQLPAREAYLCTTDWREVVDAVRELAVRGAPAIGIAGAAAVALAAAELGREGDGDGFLARVEDAARIVREARPTAVNLAVGVDRALELARGLAGEGAPSQAMADALCDLAQAMVGEDEAANRAIGSYGAALLAPGSRVLTHCNAGSLATAFYGTALGVVYAAAEQGRIERVYADETRPVGQGARLTAWELSRAGVPVTLLCDSMAASAMAQGLVDAVVVGADRIAANGDVANKVGTYGVAVLARHHGVPFYVAAPCSTIDQGCPDGAAIPIEQRDAAEVLPHPIEGVQVWNPAFDVTPASLVSAIVTERGAFAPERILDALADMPGASALAPDATERS